jgi:hypothetical protein
MVYTINIINVLFIIIVIIIINYHLYAESLQLYT